MTVFIVQFVKQQSSNSHDTQMKTRNKSQKPKAMTVFIVQFVKQQSSSSHDTQMKI